MTKSAFHFTVDDLNYFVVAAVVVAAAFVAFSGELTLGNSIFYLAVSTGILAAREFGQRTLAQWMDAEVELDLSLEGASISVLGAMTAVVTGLPFILLFPISNSFSVEKYEQWGKSVDAMWSKREAWIVEGGLFTLLATGLIFHFIDMSAVANSFWLFSAFQLLPFSNSRIPTGKLDGAYILRENGFKWLILMAFSLIGVVLV